MRSISLFARATMGLAAAFALPAHAESSPFEKATLNAGITSVTCTVTSPGGSTAVPCNASSWQPTLESGWTATMTATVSWTYSDDGLPLSPLGYFVTASGTSIVATNEAAAIYARMPNCFPGSTSACVSGTGYNNLPFALAVVSNDTTPTSTSGSFVVTATAQHTFGSFYGPWTPNLYVNLDPVVYSSTAAIPEPSTWALMLLSIPALGWAARRRRGLRGAPRFT